MILYPAYKASGIAWLGEIPSHWEMQRLRFRCRLNPSKSELINISPDTEVSFLPMEKFGEDGSLVLDETRSLEQVWQSYTYFRDHDIAVAKITPCFENGKGALLQGLVNGIGFGTTELHVLRTDEDTDPRFIFYVTRSHPFRHQGVAMMYGAAGQQRVPVEFFQNYATPFPPLPEQRTIAAFLDRETARLDTAIAEARSLISLLRERRAALIAETVTKGLDPATPRKDSGIAWLGEIPAHWGALSLKHRWAVIDCKHFTAEYVDSGIPIVSTTEVKPGRLQLTNTRTITENDFLYLTEGDRLPRRGDVIYSRNASLGSAAYVDTDERFCMGQDVCRITSDDQDQLFLTYQLNSTVVLSQIDIESVGATFKRINVAQIKDYWVACPPVEEQRAIAAYLDRETARLDAAVAEAETLIAALEEYRAALIAAAVTGKVDVRAAVSQEVL